MSGNEEQMKDVETEQKVLNVQHEFDEHEEYEDYEEEGEEESIHQHQTVDTFSSIWEMVDNITQSPFDEMFEKNTEVTLEQVLDEDALIQEVKAQNTQLVNFLAKNVDKLIDYLLVITEEDKNHEIEFNEKDEEIQKKQDRVKKEFKYPYIASEVICCDVDEINDEIINNEKTLLKLFSFLDKRSKMKDKRINPSHAAYFVKSLSALLQKYYIKIIDFISKNESILSSLIDNMGIFEMNILMLKILGFLTDDLGFIDPDGDAFSAQQKLRELFMMKQPNEDKELKSKKLNFHKWCLEKKFIPQILNKFSTTSDDTEVFTNIFSLFSEIVKYDKNPISEAICNKDVVNQLLDISLKNPTSHIFMESIPFFEILILKSIESGGNEASYMLVQSEKDIPEPVSLILSRTKDFVQILNNKPTDKLTTTFGTLDPPLGETRLKALQHILTLFKTKYLPVQKELVKTGALKIAIDLFFQYPFNSLLHNIFLGIVNSILSCPDNSELLITCFSEYKLVERLLAAVDENDQAMKKEKGMRRGYMGHILEICALIAKYSKEEKYSSLNKILEDVKGWKEFVNGTLEERNKTIAKEIGGPLPMGNSALKMFQFDYDDEEGGDYELGDEDDSDDSDDEVIVKQHTEDRVSTEEEESNTVESSKNTIEEDQQKSEEQTKPIPENLVEKNETMTDKKQDEEDWANFDEFDNQ